MSVVGVDFGFKNTLIAAAGRGGVDVLLNGNSNRLNPCMVGFEQSRSMGEGASSMATSNYKNTITGTMKRLVGLAFQDPRAQAEMKRCSFTCVPIAHSSGGPDGIGVKVNLNGEEQILSMEAVVGMMVRHLGAIAAKKAAQTSNLDGGGRSSTSTSSARNTEDQLFPKDWVLAVPCYFTDAQRRAVMAGCEMSGIVGIQRIMNEHTAVALSYGIFKDLKKEFADKPQTVMFIDFGASCYTVSIVTFEPAKLSVKSCFYDDMVGGRDFDELIAQWLAQKFEEKYKGKLSAKPMEKPKVRLKLLAAAEKAKKTLSPQGVKETMVNLECLMDDFDFNISLKKDEYEQMAQPLVDRLAKPIEMALAEAKMTPAQLSSVEIVGGTTRIGFVKKKLSAILGGKALSTTMNADEAVSRGAALQSAILSPRFKVLPYEIHEYQPFPIKVFWDADSANTGPDQGIEIEADAEGTDLPSSNSVVMFDRGTNFAVTRRVTLRRSGDFTVHVSYAENATDFGYSPHTSVDICALKIKAFQGDEKKVRVNVKEDIHGIIQMVSAQMVEEIDDEDDGAAGEEGGETKDGEAKTAEKKKKIKKTNLEFAISRPLEWTRAEMEKAYEKEVAMANADRVVRETADMRNELESYIYSMRDKIISESHLASYGTDAEKSAFSTQLESTENWLYEDGFDAVKSVYAEKLTALRKFGDPMERRQMEAKARPAAINALQQNLEYYKGWANDSQADPTFSHITDEERQTVHSKCDEVSSWMYDLLDKQGSLPLHADPAVTVAEINAKNREVTNVSSPIRHKPKPVAPPPAPPKKEESAPPPADNGDSAAKMQTEKPADGAAAQQPMDVDNSGASAAAAEPMNLD